MFPKPKHFANFQPQSFILLGLVTPQKWLAQIIPSSHQLDIHAGWRLEAEQTEAYEGQLIALFLPVPISSKHQVIQYDVKNSCSLLIFSLVDS